MEDNAPFLTGDDSESVRGASVVPFYRLFNTVFNSSNLETAQIMLGRPEAVVTQIYAERDARKKKEIVAQNGYNALDDRPIISYRVHTITCLSDASLLGIVFNFRRLILFPDSLTRRRYQSII